MSDTVPAAAAAAATDPTRENNEDGFLRCFEYQHSKFRSVVTRLGQITQFRQSARWL